ncbi:unnamed protein product, partial [Rotaria sordida]
GYYGWAQALEYCNFICYFYLLGLPFVYMALLPEVWTSIRRIFVHRNNRRTAQMPRSG